MLFSKTVENAGKNRIPHVGGKQQNEKVVHGRRIKERHSWTAHENSEEEVNLEIEMTLFFSPYISRYHGIKSTFNGYNRVKKTFIAVIC